MLKYIFAFLVPCSGMIADTAKDISRRCDVGGKCITCCLAYSRNYVDRVIEKCTANTNNFRYVETVETGLTLDQDKLDVGSFSSEVKKYSCESFSDKEKARLRNTVRECLDFCKNRKR